jgi:diketogulonate reductase-like aldo/keto reductase
VKDELLSFEKKERKLKDLDALTIDTLHGSMWGLNHRYMTLEEALIKDKNSILSYSLKRIQLLMQESNFTFKRKESLRCGVGFGTYGWKYDSRIIKAAIYYGACLIDTAEGYGYGKVENELGKILINSKPIDVITKVRRDHMSPNSIYNAVSRSVKKLNIIPHVQLHFPNDKFSNAIKDLASLRQKGIVKSIGLGNCSVDMIESAQRLVSEFSGDVIDSVQMSFSLLDNRIKKVLLPYCQERGIIVIAYSPLGQDFKRLNCSYLIKVARKYECSTAQLALAWILTHYGVVPIPATNNINHLRENLLSEDLKLDKNDVIELENYYNENKKIV